MIFDRRYQRANGAIGQLMGFPPWWIKYTTHSDQGSKEGTWIEWLYCEYITCYNLAKEADAAHPCSMANGSAYYKYVPLQESYSNNFEEYFSSCVTLFKESNAFSSKISFGFLPFANSISIFLLIFLEKLVL